MIAKVCRFYGWKPEYVRSMLFTEFNKYYQCMRSIEAQELMLMMNSNVYPKMKNEDRKSYYKKVNDIASPKHLRQVTSFDEFFELMGPKK